MANSLGPLKEKEVHLSEEWITFSIKPFGESRDYQLTALRVKIKNHNESKAHLLCANVLQKRKDKTIETVTSKMVEVKQNACLEQPITLPNLIVPLWIMRNLLFCKR